MSYSTPLFYQPGECSGCGDSPFIYDDSGNICFSGGNVGINVCPPKYTLDVSGTIHGSLGIYTSDIFSDATTNTINIHSNLDLSSSMSNISGYSMTLSNPQFLYNNSVVTKEYVDSTSYGYKPMPPCKTIAFDPVDLDNLPNPINGYIIVSGDTIIINAQSNPVDNGIYDVNSTDGITLKATRNPAMDTGFNAYGALSLVTQGNDRRNYYIVRNDTGAPIIVGTDPINFEFYYNIDFEIGDTLVYTNNTLNVSSYQPQIQLIGTQGQDLSMNGNIIVENNMSIGTGEIVNSDFVLDVAGNANFANGTLTATNASITNLTATNANVDTLTATNATATTLTATNATTTNLTFTNNGTIQNTAYYNLSANQGEIPYPKVVINPYGQITSIVTDDYLPPVSFGTPYSSSSNIYIPITYPADQKYVPYSPYPQPVITRCGFTIKINDTSSNVIDPTMITDFSTNFVNGVSKYPSPQTGNNPLVGIILTKGSVPTQNPQLNTFYDSPTSSKSVWSYVYQVSNISTNNNYITGTYYNFQKASSSYISFNGYSSGSAPSSNSVLSLTQGNFTSSSTGTQTINPPSSTNSPDNDPNVKLSNYTISYSTAGSTNRYNSQISQSGNSNVNYTGSYAANGYQPTSNTSFSITGLYPECTYSFNLNSTNTLNLTSANSYTTLPTGNTGSLAITNNTTLLGYTPSISNPTSVSSGYKYTDKTASTPLNNIYNNTNLQLSSISSNKIQYDSSVSGNNGANKTIMKMVCSLNDGTSTNTFNYQGFPLITGNSNSGTNITYTYNATTDQYSTSSDYNKGFYSQTGESYYTISSGIAASPNQYTATIQQTYYNPSGTSLATNTKSLNFYYDKLTNTPTINSGITFNINNSSTTTYASGVQILGQSNPTFTIGTSVNSLGDYFYKSGFLTYNSVSGGGASISASEDNLNNMTNYSGSIFPNPSTFSNTNVSSTISTSFYTDVSLNVQASNFAGTSSTTQVNLGAKGIFDYPSYNLISGMPSGIQTMSGTGTQVSGYRVWSQPATNINTTNVTRATYIPPAYGLNNSISYSQIGYEQSWNISSTSTTVTIGGTSYTIDTSQELQIVNGRYLTTNTNSTSRTPQTGYANYSSYFNNFGIDYSGLLAENSYYRFATFVWKYTSGSFVFTNMNFVIQNFLYNNSSISLSYDTNINANYASNNGNTQRFFVNVRAEQEGNINPTTNASGSTIWLDANAGFGTTLVSGTTPTISSNSLVPAGYTSGNYYEPNDNSIVRALGSTYTYNNNNNNTLNIQCSPIFNASAGTTYYIYCRIGLPMNAIYSFTGVNLVFT